MTNLHSFGEEKVLGEVDTEGGEPSRLVEHLLAHECGHAGSAVDAQQVGGQVDARVPRTEIYLQYSDHVNKYTN